MTDIPHSLILWRPTRKPETESANILKRGKCHFPGISAIELPEYGIQRGKEASEDAFINFLDLPSLQARNEGLFDMKAGRSGFLESGEQFVEKKGHQIQLRMRDIAIYDKDVVWTGG